MEYFVLGSDWSGRTEYRKPEINVVLLIEHNCFNIGVTRQP